MGNAWDRTSLGVVLQCQRLSILCFHCICEIKHSACH